MPAKLLAGLGLFLILTLGLKLAVLRHPGTLDETAMEQELARSIAPAGYALARSGGEVLRFEAQRGACRANLAIATYDTVNLDFLRRLHRADYAHHAEFHGSRATSAVPRRYLLDHYVARSLATLGIDWPVRPYVLVAWQRGCPAPAPDFGAMALHYRRG